MLSSIRSQSIASLPSFKGILAVNNSYLVGVSAGAYMATQMQITYSSIFQGVGVIAGGPYFCSEGIVMQALYSCMDTTIPIDLDLIVNRIHDYQSEGFIDESFFLHNHKVWIFSGSQDSVVKPPVVESLVSMYQRLKIPKENILAVLNISAEHSWVTNNYGNECGVKGSPFINNCNYDASGQMLQHLFQNSPLGALKPKGKAIQQNLLEFNQKEFFTESQDLLSLDEVGFVYVPTNCKLSSPRNEQCRLVIALHGCLQGRSYLKDQFVSNIGLNEYAETNNVIVLYPQAVANQGELNPNGCFDWFGYSSMHFANNKGPQMQTLRNMMTRLFQ